MEDATVRDALAVERTRLANERTFLAYVRTALALLAGGVGLGQFMPGHAWVPAASAALLVSGGGTLIFGIHRFVTVRRKLAGASGYRPPES